MAFVSYLLICCLKGKTNAARGGLKGWPAENLMHVNKPAPCSMESNFTFQPQTTTINLQPISDVYPLMIENHISHREFIGSLRASNKWAVCTGVIG